MSQAEKESDLYQEGRFVRSVEAVNEIVKEHESASGKRFVCHIKTKDFGKEDPELKGHRTLWEDNKKNINIPCDGVPFVVIGKKVYNCQCGKNGKRKSRKEKTRQYNCNAVIEVRHVLKLSNFEVSKPTGYNKRKQGLAIRRAIEHGERINFEERFYISRLPSPETHVSYSHEQTAAVVEGVNPEFELKPEPLTEDLSKPARSPRSNNSKVYFLRTRNQVRDPNKTRRTVLEAEAVTESTKVRTQQSSTLKSNDNDDDVIVVAEIVHAPSSPRNRRPRIVLSKEERNSIRQGGLLTDESINLAHYLLSIQFPELKGLENTTLGPLRGFSLFRDLYIQILHTGSNHWICCSNIEASEENLGIGNVDCYDSLNVHGTLTPETKLQVTQFLCPCSDTEVEIRVREVQQQTDGTKCGLFAIAFATSLAFQQSPTLIHYDEGQIRRHLLRCFEDNNMSPFPMLPGESKQKCSANTIIVDNSLDWRMVGDANSIRELQRSLRPEIS